MFQFDMPSEGATQIMVGLDARATSLEATDAKMEMMEQVVYETTESWFDTHGEGRWPPNAPSTLASKRRKGQGADPLVATGDFKDSATSAHGPHSFEMRVSDGVAFGVDWENGGWQIPVVQFYGTHNAGASHDVTIPARPAWPAHDSVAYTDMREKMRMVMFGRAVL